MASGIAINPFTLNAADGQNPVIGQGRGTEVLVSEIHGKYFTAAARGAMYSFNVTAVTVPKIAATLASVFSLYNPVGSNRLLELAFLDVSTVLAAVVVNTWGLYVSSGVLTAKGTFTTQGTAQCALLNSAQAGVGIPYSAYTHSGTPTRWMTIGMFGATTTTTNLLNHYAFDGRAVIPPGSIVSIAVDASAPATTSGSDLDLSWVETAII